MTHEPDLLRFTTAGSVDDGKSTLIGRLLYDSKAIFEDQLEQVRDASVRRGRTLAARKAAAATRRTSGEYGSAVGETKD